VTTRERLLETLRQARDEAMREFAGEREAENLRRALLAWEAHQVIEAAEAPVRPSALPHEGADRLRKGLGLR
jgi:predicted metal-dependent hydrolase